MTDIIGSPTIPTAGLNRVLEYAAIHSWNELMPIRHRG